MMLRDEIEEWMTAAPAWLNRILRSHLEALELLESHEAEAAALRAALQEALPLLHQPPAPTDDATPSLLSLALGLAPSTDASAASNAPPPTAVVARLQNALNASAGHSLLEDIRELRALHAQTLRALNDLLTWASTHPSPPQDLLATAQAALTARPQSSNG